MKELKDLLNQAFEDGRPATITEIADRLFIRNSEVEAELKPVVDLGYVVMEVSSDFVYLLTPEGKDFLAGKYDREISNAEQFAEASEKLPDVINWCGRQVRIIARRPDVIMCGYTDSNQRIHHFQIHPENLRALIALNTL